MLTEQVRVGGLDLDDRGSGESCYLVARDAGGDRLADEEVSHRVRGAMLEPGRPYRRIPRRSPSRGSFSIMATVSNSWGASSTEATVIEGSFLCTASTVRSRIAHAMTAFGSRQRKRRSYERCSISIELV